MNFCPQCYIALPDGAARCSSCHTALDATTYEQPQSMGRLASPLRRALAHFIDAIEPILILVLIGVIGTATSALIGVVLLLIYLVRVIRDFGRGQTPGKRLLNLHVVNERGEPAGYVAMIIREWPGKMLSGLCGGLGFAWILFDRHRQAWHDRLVRTYVVDRRES